MRGGLNGPFRSDRSWTYIIYVDNGQKKNERRCDDQKTTCDSLLYF